MATKQQIAKIAATIVEFQEELYSLPTEDGQWIIQHGKEAVALLVKATISRNELAKEKAAILKPISTGEAIVIEASDGQNLIKNAKKTFASGVDNEFRLETNEATKATLKTLLNVYELAKDATFLQVFTEISDDLSKVVMTQSQVILFCEKHKKWLRQEEFPTFFLSENESGYFVASVCVYDDGLIVFRLSLNSSTILSSSDHQRVVAPQRLKS